MAATAGAPLAIRDERPCIRLHLFGVKSDAWRAVRDWPGVESSDSQAWDFRAARQCREDGVRYTLARRIHHMDRWYRRQEERHDAGPCFQA